MSEIKTCKTCPLYAKTAEVKESTGLPYFGMCKGTGRFVNEAAAKALPGSTLCPATTPDTFGFADGVRYTTTTSVADLMDRLPIGDVPGSDFTATVTPTTFDVAYPLDEAYSGAVSPPALRPDACNRCVFFVPKAEAAVTFPGTPVARYDTCAKYGTLVMPGTRKPTALACLGGVATRVSAGVRAKPSDLKVHSVYLGMPEVPDFVPMRRLSPPFEDVAIDSDPDAGGIYLLPKSAKSPMEVKRVALRLTKDPLGVCAACAQWLYVNLDDGTAPVTRDGEAACPASGSTHRLTATSSVLVSPTTATDTKETSPVSTAGKTADIAAATTEDALAALLKGLSGLGAELDAPKPDPLTVESPDVISASPDDTVESDEVTADGRKALPKRPKTGMVFPASTYDLSAYEPLPDGALGVVAVRSTSKASDVVFLPRYDESLWPEAMQVEVPAESETHYMDHNDVLFRCAVAYATDNVAALWGDAGVGKTEGVEHMARLTRQPFMRISIKWATQVDDLMGRWSLTDGSMVWLEGRFVKGWRLPYIVCVDEPNCGKDEVWQALRAPFDGARTLVLDEKDGERIPRNPSARVFTAMNPSWDPRFTGTQPLNDADLDRMQHITVPYPTEDVERAILAAKAPWLTEEQQTMMLNSARDIRAAVQANTIRISFGVRKMLRWAEAMQYMHPLAAFKQSVTNWMEPASARLLADIVDAYAK